ncbi:MAG: chemotaxis protein CheW [Burkholderiaceae bacterium]|nr:chemotaxis protein CheW [Burkholderiaceae bacterium]
MEHQVTALKSASAGDATGQVAEYLAFCIGREEYGIDIQKVQELRGYESVTTIPNSPAHLKGVVNLRGVITPIVDMRIKLNVGEPSYDQFTVVIVLSLNGKQVGMVVDSVADVIRLEPEQIKPAPTLGNAVDTDYLTGIATVNERMIILMEIEKLVAESLMNVDTRLAA